MSDAASSSVAPGSPSQKRKRGAEPVSPDSGRRTKRSASDADIGDIMSSADDATAAAAAAVAAAAAAPTAPPAPPAAATAFMDSGPDSNNTGGDHLGSSEFPVIPTASAETNEAAANAARAATAAAHAALQASTTAAAALSNLYPQLTVPAPTEETFANQHVEGPNDGEHHGADTSAYGAAGDLQADGLQVVDSEGPNGTGKRPSSGIQLKPAVGTDAWHKMRKDNHKEVERRRRETINEGINELAKIVPGCEKNKGSILQRAVVFITQLKENETQNIEKWTLEKLLTEQAIGELSASNDKLKEEVERLYRELETWKRVAQNAGLQPPEEKTEAAS